MLGQGHKLSVGQVCSMGRPSPAWLLETRQSRMSPLTGTMTVRVSENAEEKQKSRRRESFGDRMGAAWWVGGCGQL